MDQHKLDYLNLEIRDCKERRTIDDVQMYCFSKNQNHKHRFHSENTHLNTLSDLTYTTLLSSRTLYSSVLPALENISKKQKAQKDKLILIEEKLEFIQSYLKETSGVSNSKYLKEIIQRLEKLEQIILS